MLFLNKISFIIFVCIFIVVELQQLNHTLILVHTIFRHGERTPETLNLYANNPYYNESYYAPFGYGQLTNQGILNSYKVGRALRKRYDGFLDETYNINLIEPRSSDFNRTKVSLQAMLAGLFPPTSELTWLEGFNWLPISFNYVERQYDKELFCYGCPNWDKYIEKYLKSEDGLAFVNQYKETFKYISEKSGENIIDIKQVYYMYFGFLIQEELNFTLPEWTKAVYPYPMRNITTNYYALMFATKQLKMLSAGYLLKKIISDTKQKINGKLIKRKMFIYSGHENNIASILKLLNLWTDDEIAPYCSYILIEVHNFTGTFGIKLYYQNYTTIEPILLNIPACGDYCIFEKFISIVQEFIPIDDNVCGRGLATWLVFDKKIFIWCYFLHYIFQYLKNIM